MPDHTTYLTHWSQQLDTASVVFKMAELVETAALFIVDRDQRVLLWNPGAEQLSGFKRDAMLGKACLPECRIDAQQNTLTRNILLSRVDGAIIKLQLMTQPVYNTRGEFYGGIGLLLPNSKQQRSTILEENQTEKNTQVFQGILSRSPAMKPVFQIIRNAAITESTVLVRGESGCGKELVARAIHNLSGRHPAPFLAINCAALTVNLLESELFGHVKGAFSGAIKNHIGLFQRANGGTLFLDEVAELPQELQAKLLRVIQERNFIPVGGSKTLEVDVRIVAATHRSLREEVKHGRFREDLMYRLRVVPIFIPPLRERREDISLLLWHFIDQHIKNKHRRIEKIDPHAMQVLLDYLWPGNIRELQNIVEYAFAVGRGTVLRLSDLPPEFREPIAPGKRQPQHASFGVEDESTAISAALQQCNGRINDAARMLNMSRATFWRKRKLYKL